MRCRLFLSRNAIALASLVVAVSSLFVAVISLRYSINAEKEDRAHKELMIKPLLEIGADTDTFSIWLITGLGPAEIKRVVFQYEQYCLDTEVIDTVKTAEFNEYEKK